MNLAERVARRFARLTPHDAVCGVAVSGGPDSLALLDLLHLTGDLHRRALVVLHVDHGIDAASAEVAGQVSRHAESRGLAHASARLELGAAASETRARAARRAALRTLADECGATAIVLAHHADDQAETVLGRLLRGSGPAGIAGMSARRGRWVRPLLGVTRREIERYVAERGLVAWTDPSNIDPRHLRSWLRSEVLPRLARRLPDVAERLVGAGSLASDARAAWDAMPELIPALDWQHTDGAISVAAPPLRGYRSPVRGALLAAIGRRMGATLGRRRLAAIDALLESGPGSRRVRVSGRLEVELAFDRLTFHRAVRPTFEAVVFDDSGPVVVGGFALHVQSRRVDDEPSRTGWSASLPPGRYTVRPWRAGDRIRPFGGTGSRAVGTLLREASIAPSRRLAWPVITAVDATVVWVPGICRSDAMIPQRGTEGLHVECIVA